MRYLINEALLLAWPERFFYLNEIVKRINQPNTDFKWSINMIVTDGYARVW